MKTDSGTDKKNVFLKYLFKHLLKKDTLILKKLIHLTLALRNFEGEKGLHGFNTIL